MAVEILFDPELQRACMFDNTTGRAFGPVFHGPAADDDLIQFLGWLDRAFGSPVGTPILSDPRCMSIRGINKYVDLWRKRRNDDDKQRTG